MDDTTVTSKGQVTIPKHIRERLAISPGTRLEVVERGEDVVLRKMKGPAESASSSDPVFDAYLKKFAGTLNLGMSTDEFMELLRGE